VTALSFTRKGPPMTSWFDAFGYPGGMRKEVLRIDHGMISRLGEILLDT